jgi:hydrogenase nickel incorporation protein HypA/HybF
MHEMSLALSIVEQTREAAAAEGAVRVLEVEIEVGSLAGVLADSLRFCLDAVAPAGGLAKTVFRVVEISAAGECLTCGVDFAGESFHACCPACGGDNVNLRGGRELKIRSLTIED